MLVEKYGKITWLRVIISGVNSDIPFDILSDMAFDLLKGPCKKM